VPKSFVTVYVGRRAVAVPVLAYRPVSKGATVGPCRVDACFPDPCLYVPGITRVEFAKPVAVEVEERGGVAVVRTRDGGGTRVYVYPEKVWRTTAEIVEAFASGRRLRQQGSST
jgi:hypothetical protein